MRGLSTTGSISLGLALVAGRNRVPRPATGNTAVRMADVGFVLIKYISWGLLYRGLSLTPRKAAKYMPVHIFIWLWRPRRYARPTGKPRGACCPTSGTWGSANTIRRYAVRNRHIGSGLRRPQFGSTTPPARPHPLANQRPHQVFRTTNGPHPAVATLSPITTHVGARSPDRCVAAGGRPGFGCCFFLFVWFLFG